MNKEERRPTILQDDELSLRDLSLKIAEWGRFLFSKSMLLILAGVAGAVIGYIYAYAQKPMYQAELSFVLENDQSAGSGGYAGIASQFGLDLGGSSGGGVFSGDNLLELMKSRSLVEKALLSSVNVGTKRLTLAEYYIDFNNLRKNWKSDPKLKNIEFLPDIDRSHFTLKHDSIIGSFYTKIVNNNLQVDKMDKKSSIMVLNVKSGNELFSKLFAEMLIKEVSDFYIDTKTRKSVDNLEILQRQADSVRRELNSAISGVALSVDANPNANPARQILLAPSQRRTVDVQANQVMLTELVKNLELSKMSLRRETPLIQIIDTPILPLKKIIVSKTTSLLTGGIIGVFILTLFLIAKKLLHNLS